MGSLLNQASVNGEHHHSHSYLGQVVGEGKVSVPEAIKGSCHTELQEATQ